MNYGTILLKILFIFFILIIIFRILGKREVGELSIFDLVILLIIADIASLGLDNNEFFWPSMASLLLLVILQKILSLILLKSNRLRAIVEGRPTIIVYDGIIKFDNMKKELYTMDDLISQMHEKHIMDINEIRLAVLETNGTLSIFRKSKFSNVILPIIVSGDYVIDNIKELNLDFDRIRECIKNNNLEIKKIMYASIYENQITYYYISTNKLKEIKANIITI